MGLITNIYHIYVWCETTLQFAFSVSVTGDGAWISRRGFEEKKSSPQKCCLRLSFHFFSFSTCSISQISKLRLNILLRKLLGQNSVFCGDVDLLFFAKYYWVVVCYRRFHLAVGAALTGPLVTRGCRDQMVPSWSGGVTHPGENIFSQQNNNFGVRKLTFFNVQATIKT